MEVTVRRLTAADFPDICESKEALRALRKPLLSAFDIYKSNVFYGVESETAAEHETVLLWYRQLLELEGDAFLKVPAGVARYVGGHHDSL